MERSAQSPAIHVVEPVRTRHAQVVMCASFVAAVVVLCAIDISPESTIADLVCAPLSIFTLLHHLIVLIVALRQRKRAYRPREIPTLVPTTARLAVVVSAWSLACFWVVVSMFYMMELRWSPRRLFIMTSIEAAILIGVSVMCTRERMETLDRLAEEPSSIVFLTGEDGEYMVAEGP